MAMKSIAIIGAGLSGLTVFHKLKNVANVTIFEKSTKIKNGLIIIPNKLTEILSKNYLVRLIKKLVNEKY